MRERSRLGIVGAGAVGTAIAYATLIRQSAREVALYDLDEARVLAEVLDLSHGTQFTGSSRVFGGGDPEVLRDCDVIVITAGAKQRPGQSRLDLAATNVEILRKLMPTLLGVAPNAVYLLVTNPCDVLAVAAQRFSGLPSHRVFSSGTVLDTSRLRWQLSERTGVATASVHAMIIGEHGDSEFALWSQCRIGPIPISEWDVAGNGPLTQSELDAIADEVKNAAYQIIEGKGATNYAIGLSAARIIEAILNDESAILPVSSVLENYRGITGVALSVPSIVGAKGIEQVLDVSMSEAEDAALQASAAKLADALKSLGL